MGALEPVIDWLEDIDQKTGPALEFVLGELAEESKNQAPQGLTGTLKASIYAQLENPHTGWLYMVFYGQIIATYIPPLIQDDAHARARARYAAKVGHTPIHPDDFYQRAWNSMRLQQARARFPDLLFQEGWR